MMFELRDGFFINLDLLICARWDEMVADGKKTIFYRLDLLQCPQTMVVSLTDGGEIKKIQEAIRDASNGRAVSGEPHSH